MWINNKKHTFISFIVLCKKIKHRTYTVATLKREHSPTSIYASCAGTATHRHNNRIMYIHPQEDKRYSLLDSKLHWSACACAHADKCFYFKQVHMLTHAAYHFNSSVQRVIYQWQVSRALCNFGRKKCDVRDDIKNTWTNLKIVRLGIARTHGWVELPPTVPTSSSHRSSTVVLLQ